MDKLTIKDIDIRSKRLLIRVDFNVPLDKQSNITDDTRIKASLPTIRYAIENRSKVILMSHLGRPDGKVVSSMRLDPVAKRLSGLLGSEVIKLEDCIGEKVKNQIERMKDGDVVLLENLRFHPEEEKNDENFSNAIAELGDIYVNDAFGTAHRAHASTEGITRFIRTAVCGFLLAKEIEYLEKALISPPRPFVAILGGSKVSDKIEVLSNLLDRVDAFLIGGGMAYTFLKAQGKEIGNSKLESDKIEVAREILDRAEKKNVAVLLPVDNLITDRIDPAGLTRVVGDSIPEGWIGVDVGTKTVDEFRKKLRPARLILWNGPLGIFEIDKFSRATEEIARFISCLAATTIIGGGDTVAAISKFGLEDKMSHISTGGGATLEFLEGRVLPGIAALQDKFGV